jgi:DNA-binding response OmpR family regulator
MKSEYSILVVDDDVRNLDIINEVLKRERFHITTARSGQDALEILSREDHGIATILLDWMMPGISGIELLKDLKQNPRLHNIPVIMQTARASETDIIQGLEAGAYYYLTKPFNLDVLVSIVKAALDKFRTYVTMEDEILHIEGFIHSLQDATFQFRTVEEGDRILLVLAKCWDDFPKEFFGVKELLINAVEHGNLQIMYDRKSEFIHKGIYHEQLELRQQKPENLKKYVTLRFKRLENVIEIMMEDMGNGFDYKKYMDFSPRRIFDTHGRGIALAKRVHGCDIQYIDPGNKVIITIPLHQPTKKK